jgi:hypothetical protein
VPDDVRRPEACKLGPPTLEAEAVVAETVPHWCVFCDAQARRIHMDDVPHYVIDCARCGRYSISPDLDRRAHDLRDEHYLKTVQRHIKPANLRGHRFDVDSGHETPFA